MAQNVTIAGAEYTGVPSINVPKIGGGSAGFYDVSETTATAQDVAAGKLFMSSQGILTTGTSSGGSIKRIIIRPDAELTQSWTYDKRIVKDEGITIPPYQSTTVTLKATEQLDEITADAENYKYFLTFRTLVIPEYNTDDVARGRFEWSSMVGAYEFVFTPMEELHPLIPGTFTIATNSASVQGGTSYRSLYFTSSTGISIYPNTVYGIWTSAVSPSYLVGKIRVNSPNFTMRAQANIFDQSYYEALTDIRFQYVYELWRVPVDSLDYRGWMNQQSADFALDCLYSADHKLL